MERSAIIVAGGSGKRMGSAIPKQFLELAGKPILMHTLEAFRRAGSDIRIIVVLPADSIEQWQKLCKNHGFRISHDVVVGGKERSDSVRNGLKAIDNTDIVAVHDGVRCLVSPQLIERCMAAVAEHGAVVPVLPVSDSLRKVEGGGNHAVDRSEFRAVQTPQCFHKKLLMDAFEKAPGLVATDEATVVERSGESIHLVEGEPTNIKITTPSDLQFAETILATR